MPFHSSLLHSLRDKPRCSFCKAFIDQAKVLPSHSGAVLCTGGVCVSWPDCGRPRCSIHFSLMEEDTQEKKPHRLLQTCIATTPCNQPNRAIFTTDGNALNPSAPSALQSCSSEQQAAPPSHIPTLYLELESLLQLFLLLT